MKKSKVTDAHIVFALMQSETSALVDEIFWKMEISESKFFNWKKKCGGMGVTELRELR